MEYHRLTQKEVEDLRNEMKQAGQWAKEVLKRRRQCKSLKAQEENSSTNQHHLQNKP